MRPPVVPLRLYACKRERILRIVALLLAVVLAPLAPTAGSARPVQAASPVLTGLHAQGNALVNGAGQSVRLFGVNHPGSEYACVQGWGVFDGPSDAASVQAVTAWHITAVRIPLNEDCWLGINGVDNRYAGAAYQQAIAAYVATITQAGLVAILDLHWNAPGSTMATGQEPMADRDHAPDFWRGVASTFKSNSSVVFDLYNEPHDITWACWRDGGACAGVSFPVAGMQELVTAVRSVGATNVVMLGGLAWANDLSQWLAYKPVDPLNNIAAGWHVYNFNACDTTSCYDSQAAPVATQVPLIVGEFAENDRASSFIMPLMTWLDAHNASYMAWAWAAWGDWQSLITDQTGAPSSYFGQPYKDHLAVAVATPPSMAATNTPVPATATNTPVPATATNTALPATATNTALPATATNTALPATVTNTALPATATNTALPATVTNTPVPAATATAPASGGSVAVSLQGLANNAGTSSDTSGGVGNFDGQGYSYSAQALQGAGFGAGQTVVVNGVGFRWPAATTGSVDNIRAQGQTVTLPTPASGASLAVLGAANNGPASGTGTIAYSDGTTQAFTLALGDWTLNGGSAQPLAGSTIAATMTYRNNGGHPETIKTYVFYAAVPLQAGKSVARVILPAAVSQGGLHLFALSVAGASPPATPTPPATTSTATATHTPAPVAPPATATNTVAPLLATATATRAPLALAVTTALPVPTAAEPVAEPLAFAIANAAASGSPVAPVAPGGVAPLTVTITATRSLANELVDFEVYTSAGQRVWQGWRAPITFVAGTPRTLALGWPVPATQPAGVYTFKVGLFTATWQGQQWDNGVARVIVGGSSVAAAARVGAALAREGSRGATARTSAPGSLRAPLAPRSLRVSRARHTVRQTLTSSTEGGTGA